MSSANSMLHGRNDLTFKRAAAIYRSLGTPYALDRLNDLHTGNYKGITSATLNPDDYVDPDAFACDYLALNLLRKYDSFPLGIDTAAVAIQKFLDSEVACSKINRSVVRPYVLRNCGFTPEAVIHTARAKIGRLLGDFSWDAASEGFGFSGGASTRNRRKAGAPYYKFQGKPETTRNNALLAVSAIRSIPLWSAEMAAQYGDNPCDWVTVVEGSKVTTVAKTAETDRCIAIEPCMNMFIQRGIGAVIRQRLKSVKIDLNDQTRNQVLARIGSTTGSLTTIDLASASDSIALELVRLLLPPDWFEAMCLCRSEVGILPNGVKHRFEKISSMGNGYTFELESLIFWALSSSTLDLLDVSDRRLGIYGDDIVIHNSCASELIEVLDYCGFKTNVEKTFLSGPFRESCGKHYFYGVDVTPFYIKTPLDSLSRWFWVANSLRLFASHRCNPWDFQSVYHYLVRSIPKRDRFLVPYSYGSNSGLWASFDEARPRFQKWRQAFSLKLLRHRRRSFDPNGVPAVLHWFSNNQGSGVSSDRLKIEKGEGEYVRSRTYSSWWDNAPVGVVIIGN